MKVRRIDFSPDEWLAGTVGLDNATRGLFITACALIYSAGGPITLAHLKAACRDHGRAINRQLDTLVALGKLTIDGCYISNKRSLNELKKAEIRSINARNNSSKKAKNNGLADDSDHLTINHQPSTINLTPPLVPPSQAKGGKRRAQGPITTLYEGAMNAADNRARERAAQERARNLDPDRQSDEPLLGG